MLAYSAHQFRDVFSTKQANMIRALAASAARQDGGELHTGE